MKFLNILLRYLNKSQLNYNNLKLNKSLNLNEFIKKPNKSTKITVTTTTTAAGLALVFLYNYYYYLNQRKYSISDLVKEYQIYFKSLILNQQRFVLHARDKKKQKPDAECAIDFDDDEQPEESFTGNNIRKKIFFHYASVEYNGIPYMTPQDFIDSVTFDRSRPKLRRKVLKKADVEKYLKNTPSLKANSTKYFRNLENRGLITYSEYLFLLCVITKPSSRFEIAFNMFDIDGNKWVDKREFLVLERVLSSRASDRSELNNKNNPENHDINETNLVTKIFQRDTERKLQQVFKDLKPEGSEAENTKLIDSLDIIDVTEYIDTTLLVHLFGQKGKDVLYFNDFKRFMENLQTEILEVEFNEFAKGLNKISELEFAEILLRYTEFEEDIKNEKLNKLQSEIEEYSRGISFEKFKEFSTFMNNLDDFSLALKYHTYANKSISKNEFQRAVKISSGFELDDQIVDVIFRVFDEDNDGHLSYKEFIAVMKDRIRRNPKSHKKSSKGNTQTFSQEFKACMRSKLHDDQYY